MLSDSPPAIFSDTAQIIHKFKLMNTGIKKDVLGIGAYIRFGQSSSLKKYTNNPIFFRTFTGRP